MVAQQLQVRRVYLYGLFQCLKGDYFSYCGHVLEGRTGLAPLERTLKIIAVGIDTESIFK